MDYINCILQVVSLNRKQWQWISVMKWLYSLTGKVLLSCIQYGQSSNSEDCSLWAIWRADLLHWWILKFNQMKTIFSFQNYSQQNIIRMICYRSLEARKITLQMIFKIYQWSNITGVGFLHKYILIFGLFSFLHKWLPVK